MFRLAQGARPANDVSRGGTGDHERRDKMGAVARAAASGSPRAAHTLLVGVGPAMLRVIRKVLGDAGGDAKDVLQDSMVALMKALGGFREECSVTHFACRVAVMTALAWRRRVRHQEGTEPGFPVTNLGSLATPDCDPAAAAEVAARRSVLWRLLDELPALQAEALALHCMEGFTVEEVAAATGSPMETVKSRLRIGKSTLRARITEDLTARDLFGRER